MEEHKTCPFMSKPHWAEYVAITECVQNECALWDKTGRCCTFASMAWSLSQLIAAVKEQKGD